METYGAHASITHSHSVIAASEAEAYENGCGEAKDAFRRHFGLGDSVEVEVFEDVTDLDASPDEGYELDPGEGLYLLTAHLPFYVQAEVPSMATADDIEDDLVAEVRTAAAKEYALTGIATEDICVFNIEPV